LASKEKIEKHVPVSGSAREERSNKKEEEGKTELALWRDWPVEDDINRMFNDFARGFDNPFVPLLSTGWLARRRGLMRGLSGISNPAADLIDSGNEYRVVADVPGIQKDKLNVTVTEREIRIEGEAKTDISEDKEGFVRRERGYSRVLRTLSFPEHVIPDKAVANLANGVLEVRIPKETPTKVTKHKVVVK
jgi:HSP20 family protein